MCGENSNVGMDCWYLEGSSPRVRGKLTTRFEHKRKLGLIPACAGKTLDCTICAPMRGAHPRVCGENSSAHFSSPLSSGSSPRVRGKRYSATPPVPMYGLIPACAGKTRSGLTGLAPSRAHPRVCGENAFAKIAKLVASGSSPRVRGKQPNWLARRNLTRLIPACAGKTQRRYRGSPVSGAHPRVCGENKSMKMAPNPSGGSSPRVRGKLDCEVVCLQLLGLIPACAGKTWIA